MTHRTYSKIFSQNCVHKLKLSIKTFLQESSRALEIYESQCPMSTKSQRSHYLAFSAYHEKPVACPNIKEFQLEDPS